jgi:hypothetical protein
MDCSQALVVAHARMLDPLLAEESMRAAEWTSVGSPAMSREDATGAKRTWRAWERRADRHQRERRRAAASPALLAAMGIRYEAPPPPATADAPGAH